MITRFLAELRALNRYWSVRLAAFAGLVAAWLFQDPSVLPRLVAILPEHWRPLASILVGFAVYALPTVVRRLPQPGIVQDKPPA